MPSLSALKVNCDSWPGAVKLEAAPPPGPVTPCRSMLCGILLVGWFFKWNSTVSPWRTRMKLPGTVPPKVQKVYETPSEIAMSFSTTSSSTITLAGVLRVIGGGTFGGLVSTARIGAPCGEPGSAAPHRQCRGTRVPRGGRKRRLSRKRCETSRCVPCSRVKVHLECTYRRKRPPADLDVHQAPGRRNPGAHFSPRPRHSVLLPLAQSSRQPGLPSRRGRIR